MLLPRRTGLATFEPPSFTSDSRATLVEIRQFAWRTSIPDNTHQTRWDEQPDGSRARLVNGIRIVDRTSRRLLDDGILAVEHLVTWQEDGGRVLVMGLDASCRPVSVATLYAYL